jgi:hypothetical protein
MYQLDLSFRYHIRTLYQLFEATMNYVTTQELLIYTEPVKIFDLLVQAMKNCSIKCMLLQQR